MEKYCRKNSTVVRAEKGRSENCKMSEQDEVLKNATFKVENECERSSILHEQQVRKFWDAVMENNDSEPLVGITLAGETFGAYYRNITEQRHFNRIVKLNPDDVVLDLGCGIGRWTVSFASKCRHVTAVDISQNAIDVGIKEAKKRNLTNITFMQGSLADYVDDKKYDVIFIGGVLIYIDDKRLMTLSKNVCQMIKPAGKLVLRETVSLLDTSFSIDRYHKEYNERYKGYYRPANSLLSFFLKDFKLIYQRETYVDMYIVKIITRIFPKFFQNSSIIKLLCKLMICVQAIIDPILLESKWLLNRRNERIKCSDDPAAQFFFVLTKWARE